MDKQLYAWFNERIRVHRCSSAAYYLMPVIKLIRNNKYKLLAADEHR